MSVIITNITRANDPDAPFLPTGKHDYVLKINQNEIVRFSHIRERGLSQCLRDAADAYDAKYPPQAANTYIR